MNILYVLIIIWLLTAFFVSMRLKKTGAIDYAKKISGVKEFFSEKQFKVVMVLVNVAIFLYSPVMLFNIVRAYVLRWFHYMTGISMWKDREKMFVSLFYEISKEKLDDVYSLLCYGMNRHGISYKIYFRFTRKIHDKLYHEWAACEYSKTKKTDNIENFELFMKEKKYDFNFFINSYSEFHTQEIESGKIFY